MKSIFHIKMLAAALGIVCLLAFPCALAEADDNTLLSESEEYFETIDLTRDNFDEFFRIVQIENIQEYTDIDLDTDEYDYFIVASNAYERGLLLYDGNMYAARTTYKLDGSSNRNAALGIDLYESILKTKKGTVPSLEEWSDYGYGSAVFLKREYVRENIVYEDGGRMLVLSDGTETGMNTFYLQYYDAETNTDRNLHIGELYSLYPY